MSLNNKIEDQHADIKQFEVSDSEYDSEQIEQTAAKITPKLCIFSWREKSKIHPYSKEKVVGRQYIDMYFNSLKVLIYSTWRKNVCLSNKTVAEIDRDLLKLDWLSFQWGAFPRIIWDEIFTKLPYDIITFLSGHYGTYYGEIIKDDSENKTKIVDSLYQYFVEEYTKNYCNHSIE